MTDAVKELSSQHGGVWGEHPEHKVADWRCEVYDDDTRLGYWEWVQEQLDADADDSAADTGDTV